MKSWDFEFYVDGVALTLVSIFGLIGTLLSIRVLVNPQLRTSFSNLLVGLAVCDASFLSCAILIIGLPKAWTWYQSSVSIYVIPIVYGMIGVTRMGSVYLTMSVTLERYFAIVKPLSSFRMKRWLVPISLIFAVVYNVPRFFELERYIFPHTNETLVRATSLRKNKLYISIYNTWMKMVFLEAIPYITIIFLNAKIINQIITSGRFRRRFIKEENKRENQPIPEEMGENGRNKENVANKKVTETTKNTTPKLVVAEIEDENSKLLQIANSYQRKRAKKKRIRATVSYSEELNQIGEPRSLRSIKAKRNRMLRKNPCFLETSSSCPNIAFFSKKQGGSNHSSICECPDLIIVESEISPKRASYLRHRVQAQLRKVVPNGLNRQQQQELSLGLTLVFISVLFIVCQSVKIVPDLYELFCSTNGITSQSTSGNVTCHSTQFIDTLISLANLFACINSAANFLIYMLRGKKFREAFLSTYSCKKANQPNPTTAGNQQNQRNSLEMKRLENSMPNGSRLNRGGSAGGSPNPKRSFV